MQRAKTARGLRFLPTVAFITTVGLISAMTAYQASAQINVFTSPVGFTQVPIVGPASDSLISFPFTQIPSFTGTLASAPGSGSTFAINGSPGWTAGQWATTTLNGFYPNYAFITSGNQAGAWFTITNNDASDLYVVLTPENASLASAGDYVQIIPFLTLNTVWPNGQGVVTTTSTLSLKTQILFPNIGGVGKNLSASATYYFFNNAWRHVSSSTASNFNDVEILPDQYVTIREPAGVPATNFMTLGSVVTNNIRVPIYANAPANGNQQDNFVAIYRPSVFTLDQSGLSNVVAVTTSTLNLKDQVLVFDNTTTNENKSPSATYYFFNNAWRKVSAPTSVNFGPTNIFNINYGFIYRAATNPVPTRIWSNAPNY